MSGNSFCMIFTLPEPKVRYFIPHFIKSNVGHVTPSGNQSLIKLEREPSYTSVIFSV